ncbi:hypothetical protein BTS2_3763 [Bacillus sp. TS-2]|nr:hypothetical protein BTS2_3763 [Bacillus sp. TS-2]
MNWLGIGVFIISLVFAGFLIILIPVIKKITATLENTAKVISQTEESLNELTGEVKLMLYNTNETLIDVNEKVRKLNPIFDTIEEVGKASHHVSSTLADYTDRKSLIMKEGINEANNKKAKGFVRALILFYYLKKKKSSPTV